MQRFAPRDVAGLFIAYPPGFGVGLAAVYGAWVAVVAALWPVSAWFAGVKRRRHAWWLRYV
jgi:hypothetical protein